MLGARQPRSYAHKIPFIVKLNHNELLTYPNKFDQIMFGSVEQAFDLGAAGVGATIYFGSDESTRQIQEVSRGLRGGPRARACSPCCGATCATAPSRPSGADYHVAADLTGQANHLGVTIEADIIKQKLPGEQRRLQRLLRLRQDQSKLVYDELTTDHPIDLCRWQVANCYMGRIGLINSRRRVEGRRRPGRRGAHRGDQQAGRRHGPDLGRKAFQRPMAEGVELLNAIQDVYLDAVVTIA